ncbi:SDR family oxidoreductase OS=Streptomyces alboniger OX=132473 GN=CP975_04805 PE=3 SV=1 [Streptomyces alboniger]
MRVNAIAPAVVKTQFAEGAVRGAGGGGRLGLPAGPARALPSDIGGTAAFLTSEQSDWMTGQTLVVDGGIFLNAGVG